MGSVRRAGPAGLVCAALGAALGAVLAAGCSAGPAAPFRATEQTCYAFVVQALQRHITVTTVPQPCAGLSHAQIDQAVARGLRDVAGLGPKAAARRRTYQDSRYVARLIQPVPLPTAAPGPAPVAGAPTGPSPDTALRLAALAAWVVTAAAGAYLLAGWLGGLHGLRALRGLRGRRSRAAGRPPAILISHASVAVAGLGIWLAFVVSAVSVLAWIAVGLILPLAGLGMATLLAAPSGAEVSTGSASTGSAGAGQATAGPAAAAAPTAGTASPAAVRMPVIAIALHGVLATATILLVLLAAIGVR